MDVLLFPFCSSAAFDSQTLYKPYSTAILRPAECIALQCIAGKGALSTNFTTVLESL